MKRGILFAILVALVVVGIYSVKEWMPVMAIAGTSMQPQLKQGDAVFISKLDASEAKVGDVIVFSVPPLIQSNYHYPAIVAHRIIEITEFQNELAFKTKGDNTAEDPFVVPSSDLRGQVSGRVPYLGHIILFLQSKQGMIFAIIALVLIGIELYFDEIRHGRRRLQRGIFAPVIEQNQEIAKKQQETSQMTVEALEKFSAAVAEYAKHLASHTSAIQGLSEASHELKRGAAEQNRVLSAIMETVVKADAASAVKLQDSTAHKPETKKAQYKTIELRKTTPPQKTAEPKYHKALQKGLVNYNKEHAPATRDPSKKRD